MKKLIVLFLFLISCTDQSLVEDSNIILEIEPDTNEGESSESQNYSNDNVLEYPVDFDIEELFECLGGNGVNPIPSPEFNNNNILIKFDDGYSQDFIDNFKSTSRECEEKMKNN